MSFDKPPVVIDNGSYSIKAGFACDNHPVSIFRTLVGRPSYLNGKYGREYYDVFIGNEAVEKVKDLELNHPVVSGKIVHWDNMERIWHHILYRELKAAPEDRAVILALAPTTTIKDKIKCSEIYFETLNSPSLCIQSQSVLAVYGSGLTTGISVDIGYDTTDIVPVYEGGMISFAQITTGLAGCHISDYIKKCLNERNLGKAIKNPEDVERIKRDCLYVTTDISMQKKNVTCTLPSGEEIDVTNEAFLAGEMFFQPDVAHSEPTNIIPLHEAIITAALKCDADLQEELWNGIVSCGGLAMVPGMNDRLSLEIENRVAKPIQVLSSTEAYAVSWLGGATFAGLSDADTMWVEKKQYEEQGEKILRNKFL